MYNFDKRIDRRKTNSVKYDLLGDRFGNADLLPMWVADMDFETPGFIMNAIEKRLKHPVLGYSIRPDSFYESIINWVQKRYQWKIKKDWISFSPGVVPGLNLSVLEFTQPGDSILVQPPVYFPFFSAISMHERMVAENPLVLKNERLEIDYQQLNDQLPKSRMFMFCNPHNPGGMCRSKKELQKIASLLEQHGTFLISDEIHADLTLPGIQHFPLASISDKIAANSITFMSASKTFNIAGLSTAFAIIPNPEIRKRYEFMLWDKMHLGMGNIFGNVALEAAFTHGEPWLNSLMEYVAENIRFANQFINEFMPRMKPVLPEATYMLWLDCRDLNLSNEDLRTFFINKAGLALNDGPIFGTGGEGFQRMNLACPKSVVKTALQQLKSAYDKLD